MIRPSGRRTAVEWYARRTDWTARFVHAPVAGSYDMVWVWPVSYSPELLPPMAIAEPSGTWTTFVCALAVGIGDATTSPEAGQGNE
jgi:hypothetical protein